MNCTRSHISNINRRKLRSQHLAGWAYVLDEPLELLRIVRTAIVSGPGVADGEFVELQHVHDADFCHCTAVQVRALVHARRCVYVEVQININPNSRQSLMVRYIYFWNFTKTSDWFLMQYRTNVVQKDFSTTVVDTLTDQIPLTHTHTSPRSYPRAGHHWTPHWWRCGWLWCSSAGSDTLPHTGSRQSSCACSPVYQLQAHSSNTYTPWETVSTLSRWFTLCLLNLCARWGRTRRRLWCWPRPGCRPGVSQTGGKPRCQQTGRTEVIRACRALTYTDFDAEKYYLQWQFYIILHNYSPKTLLVVLNKR